MDGGMRTSTALSDKRAGTGQALSGEQDSGHVGQRALEPVVWGSPLGRHYWNRARNNLL